MRVLVEQVPGADWAAAVLQPAAADLPAYLSLLAGEVTRPPAAGPRGWLHAQARGAAARRRCCQAMNILGVQASKAEAGLQAWTLLAPQLPWPALGSLPGQAVEERVLPSLASMCDETSIGASQGLQTAHAAGMQLVQARALCPLGAAGQLWLLWVHCWLHVPSTGCPAQTAEDAGAVQCLLAVEEAHAPLQGRVLQLLLLGAVSIAQGRTLEVRCATAMPPM